MLKRISGCKRDEITRKSGQNCVMRKFSPNIIRVIKTRRARWTGHAENEN